MHETSQQRKVVVINPEGFHMRPIAAFAETALRFQSHITVSRANHEADGKSPLSLMGLAAGQGTELLVKVAGLDAQAALKALLDVLGSLSVAAEVREQEVEEGNRASESRDKENGTLDSGFPGSGH